MSKERIIKNSMLDKETNCWIWLGTKKGSTKLKMYGSMTIGSRKDKSRKTISAHRHSFTVFKGEIPDGLFVCHKCDNPSCVNPDHLFLGTRQDNVNDRELKNRNNHVFGEKVGCAKLNDTVVLEIIEKYKTGCYTQRELGKYYGINHTTIGSIIRGKTWRHVKPTPPAPKTQ